LIFAFTVISSMAGESIPKGLISCALGMLFAMVGMSNITGATRFTFGITELISGFSFTPMLMGVLVMPEIINIAKQRKNANKVVSIPKPKKVEDSKLSYKEYFSILPTILKSTGIGTIIGALPGLGSSA